MATGKITQIDTDWYGDTLAAPVTATDTILTVFDVIDFDEDEDEPNRWQIVGDSAPMRYVAINERPDRSSRTSTLWRSAAGAPVVWAVRVSTSDRRSWRERSDAGWSPRTPPPRRGWSTSSRHTGTRPPRRERG